MNDKSVLDRFLEGMRLPTEPGRQVIQIESLQFQYVGYRKVPCDQMEATDGVFTYTVFDTGCVIIKAQNIAIVNDSTSKDIEEAIARVELWRREIIYRLVNAGNDPRDQDSINKAGCPKSKKP